MRIHSMKALWVGASVLLLWARVAAYAAPVPREFPDTTSGIHVVGFAPYASESTVEWAATHFDMIARFSLHREDLRRAYRKINPDVSLIAYIDILHAPYSHSTFLDDSEFLIHPDVITANPDWALKKPDGSIYMFKPYNRPLMDPGSPGWREYVARQAVYATDGKPNEYPQLQKLVTPCDGVVLDEPGSTLLADRMKVDGPPVNPRTGELYTEEEWHKDWLGMLEYVNKALKDRWPDNPRKGYCFINTIDPFSEDPRIRDKLRPLLAHADGTSLEGFIHDPWQQPERWHSWWRCMDDMKYVREQGKAVATISGSSAATPTFYSRIHMYSLASHLLLKNHQSYFIFINLDFPGVLRDEAGLPYWWKGWAADIGSPVSEVREGPSGTYMRSYSNGLVAVNPTGESAEIELERPLFGLREDGAFEEQPTTRLTLPAQTGAILLSTPHYRTYP